MKIRIPLSVAASTLAVVALADSTVSDVVVRQRWPWSETVDIDYTLTGDKGDVTFTATWDGQATPVMLGTDFQVEAGQHRFEWCPTNNYAGQTLTGFTVTAAAGSAADHKYLILDLVNGGYTFASEPPAGGWREDDVYKSTKMVFTRCPAGVYTNGITNADLEYICGETTIDSTLLANYKTAFARHVTTFSSDWYIGIFTLTSAQYSQVVNGSGNSSYASKLLSYNSLRGSTNDTPCINWPESRYAVTENSFVDRLRKLASNSLVIDLPTEEQFESAIRCGATTYWPNGGTREDSYETLKSIYDAIAPASMGEVGYYSVTNAFGLYDFMGYGACSLCLDAARPRNANLAASYPYHALSDKTDPVGNSYPWGSAYASTFLQHRVLKGQSNMTTAAALYTLLPCFRQTGRTTNTGYCVRLAIHLKPLNFGN